METIHNESTKIAKRVLMPGDPLRAEYAAKKYLQNAQLVNDVRNNYAYTGTYKGYPVTIMSSGMGSPSIGIYAYELYKFYDVERIIRIGTCGSNDESVKVKDVVLATQAYTLSSFPKLFYNDDNKFFKASEQLNSIICQEAENHNICIKTGNTITSDVFDPYVDDWDRYMSNYPKDIKYVAMEMEAATLFCLANHMNKQAAALLTVVDSKFEKTELSSEERQQSLDDMIVLALESIIK